MPEEFEYRGYRLGQETGRPSIYVYWYDRTSGRGRRKSLGTKDWDAAKTALYEFVAINDAPKNGTPDTTYLSVMLERYLSAVTDKKQSAEQARIAAAKIMAHWGDLALVSDLTADSQRAFIKQLGTKNLSVSYIARTMSVLSAARNYALRENDLTFAPAILHSNGSVADILDAPLPKAREWIPTFEQVAQFLAWCRANKRREHVWRYAIFELNTGARPQAILDFETRQINHDYRLLNLNPPGRKQQPKKFRPEIKASDCLWSWIEYWDCKGALIEQGRRKRRPQNMKNPFRRAAQDLRISKLSPYTFRHFVATYVYDELWKARVPDAKDHVAYLLGHKPDDPKTTDRYVKYTEGFMQETVQAIDRMMDRLQEHCMFSVRTPTFLPQGPNEGVN